MYSADIASMMNSQSDMMESENMSQHSGQHPMDNGGGGGSVGGASARSGSASGGGGATPLLERIRAQQQRAAQQQPLGASIESLASSTQQQAEFTPQQLQSNYDNHNNIAYSNTEGAGGTTTTPSTVRVPQYSAQARDDFGHFMPGEHGDDNNFFRNAWNNISHSVEQGMAELDGNDNLESMDSLLSPQPRGYTAANNNNTNYSMSNYFLTFVRDIYQAFMSLPMPGRVVLVIVLLYVAIKML